MVEPTAKALIQRENPRFIWLRKYIKAIVSVESDW